MAKTLTWLIRLLLIITAIAIVSKVTELKTNTLIEAQNSVGTPVTAAERDRQLTCLAKNIYHEAASEPFEGKVAVAQVTMNRASSSKFPDDICQVVYQKNVIYGKVICQFTWYCENGPVIRSNALYRESMEVAKKVLLENFRLPSMKYAYYYHADYVNPNWKLPKIGQIGRHIFYGQKT